jgi:nitroreductase
MSDRGILSVIRERRSVVRFTADPVPEADLQEVLEAGRWAPSFLNAQPWDFVVLRDPDRRRRAVEILARKTVAWRGFAEAPVLIAVAVDPAADPYHSIEDGAAAAENMALAAQALGLATCWAGVIQGGKPEGAEAELAELLCLPKGRRIIAVLPVGKPAYAARSDRKPLAAMVHTDRYTASAAERH